MPTYSSEELWGKVCDAVQAKVSESVYKTWIFPNQLAAIEPAEDGVTAIIEAPTSFHISFLEKNFRPILVETFAAITETKVNLIFRVGSYSLNTRSSRRNKKTASSNKPLIPTSHMN